MVAALTSVMAQQGEVSFRFDLAGIIALIAGILILIVPRLLNYIVAAYLIIFGLITLFNVNV